MINRTTILLHDHLDPLIEQLYQEGLGGCWNLENSGRLSSVPDVGVALAEPVTMATGARAFYRKLWSRMYWAEFVTLEIDICFLRRARDADARLFLLTHINDEARHMRAARKMALRLGAVLPYEPQMYRGFLFLKRYAPSLALLAAFTTAERIDAAVLPTLVEIAPDPLSASVFTGILEDECRHVRFFTHYLDRYMAETSGLGRKLVKWTKYFAYQTAGKWLADFAREAAVLQLDIRPLADRVVDALALEDARHPEAGLSRAVIWRLIADRLDL